MLIFASEYPRRPIQIQFGFWENIGEILAHTDIDCTGVAFDGRNVWATHRAQLAINTRTNIACKENWNIRGTPKYEDRLYKYSKRGFGVIDYTLDRLKINNDIFTFRSLREVPNNVAGQYLLLQLENNEEVAFTYVNNTKYRELSKTDIPYGPKTSFDLMHNFLQQRGYSPDDGYGSGEKGYNIITVDDIKENINIVNETLVYQNNNLDDSGLLWETTPENAALVPHYTTAKIIYKGKPKKKR